MYMWVCGLLVVASQERLAVSNRHLRQWHDVLVGKVVALMSTDLVRHKDRCGARR